VKKVEEMNAAKPAVNSAKSPTPGDWRPAALKILGQLKTLTHSNKILKEWKLKADFFTNGDPSYDAAREFSYY
jgi:hypothetical protein